MHPKEYSQVSIDIPAYTYLSYYSSQIAKLWDGPGRDSDSCWIDTDGGRWEFRIWMAITNVLKKKTGEINMLLHSFLPQEKKFSVNKPNQRIEKPLQ